MTKPIAGLTAALMSCLVSASALAQTPAGQEKQILPLTTQSWAAFRNYDGKQWIYLTHLITYRCGLSEIRYSIGSDALDQTFPLPPCDQQRPHAIDPIEHPPYLVLPPDSAHSITLQVVYSDGEESETVRLAPCEAAGDSACAVLTE